MIPTYSFGQQVGSCSLFLSKNQFIILFMTLQLCNGEAKHELFGEFLCSNLIIIFPMTSFIISSHFK